jgi:hypothetical protein
LNRRKGPRKLQSAMLDRATINTMRKRSYDLRIDNLTAIATAGNGNPGGKKFLG